ncbi:serine hydrolase [Hymenobacter sp. 5317J-9]|uniref:serine hydrolase n=1 Tax=Hymenobacter sp. 5317J-9 TaxID=2932250 RepID=UPI001FD6E92A|nr:serine hydrolase [Hymenobacter sp. 5317J-9]UOQ97415.1 serine hydrolase [Hymenobacter sp. 5317J-9]
MKHLVLISGLLFVLLLAGGRARAQSTPLYFPPLTGTTWASTTPASLGWCQTPLDSLIAFARRKGSKSLLILKDGRMVVEQYYGTYTADSAWYWASAGKSLTAALVGLAQQDGILSLSDSTSKYLGRWTSATRPQQRQIQIRHQLTMTTGLDDTPPAPCDNESTTPGCLLYLTTPATRWAYHTGAYRTLQDVLVQASGAATITQYTNQRLATRLGMTGLWLNDVYYSRARSMARFGLFILARGAWNGTQILDTAYFRRMTTPSQTLNRSYGYLWWLNGQPSYKLPGSQLTFPGAFTPAAPPDMIAALGKNDQKIYVVPSLGLVVVRQGNSAGPRTLAVSSFDNELWTRIMAVFCRPTATAAAADAAGFLAFPNPATEVLTLRQPAHAAATVRLTDALGREVWRRPAPGAETSVSVAALAPGLYAVQWLDAAGRVLMTRKVARQ